MLEAIHMTRAAILSRAWDADDAGSSANAANSENPLVADLDATPITPQSANEEDAATAYKRGFGHHPLA